MSYRIQFEIFCNTPREVFVILEDNLSNVPIGKIEYNLFWGILIYHSKWEKDRQTDRQRLKSFGRGRENKIVGLLRLDCTFPFFFFRVIVYFY